MIVAIELTDQQRQIVEAQKGRIIEVVDPTTRRTYFLVAAEMYERLRGLLEGDEVGERFPAQEADATGAELPGARRLRQRLRDLPTPPDVAERVQRRCEKLGLSRKESRAEVEEELKLQYYFGGQYVGYLRSAEGKIVIAAGRLDSEEFSRQLDALDPEERRKVVLDVPSRWNETVSQILTPFAHES